MKNFDGKRDLGEKRDLREKRDLGEKRDLTDKRELTERTLLEENGSFSQITNQLHRLSVRELENLAGALCDFNEPSENYNNLINLCLGERQSRLKPIGVAQ